jgi:hypothetical protein
LIGLAAVCLVLSGAAFVAGRVVTGDWFSPAALVATVWLGTFSLYLLFLLPYRPLEAKWAVPLACSLAALLVGIGAGTRWAQPAALRGEAPSTRHANVWVEAYALAGMLGFVWYVWAVVSAFGWPVLRYGSTIRRALGDGRIPSNYLFLEFFCIVAPLLAWAYWLSGVRIGPRAISLSALCVAMLWLTTDRTQFFTVVLVGLFMYFARHGSELSLRRALGVMGAAFVALVLNFMIVGVWVGKIPEAKEFRLRAPRTGSLPMRDALPDARGDVAAAMTASRSQPLPAAVQKLALVYLYASGSYPAFAALVEEAPNWTLGAHMFYPILRALERMGLYHGALPQPIPEFRLITTGGENEIRFNAYTYLYYPYEDFGGGGMIAVSALMGFACGAVYGRLRSRRTSPGALILIGQIQLALLFSFFVNKFNNTASWYIAFWSVLPFIPKALALRGQRVGRARATEDLVP